MASKGCVGRSASWYGTQRQGVLGEEFRHELHHLNYWYDSEGNKVVGQPSANPTSMPTRPTTGANSSKHSNTEKDHTNRPDTSMTSASRPATGIQNGSRPSTGMSLQAGADILQTSARKTAIPTIDEHHEVLNEGMKAWTSYRGHFRDPTPHRDCNEMDKTFFKPRTVRGVYQERCILQGAVPSKKPK